MAIIFTDEDLKRFKIWTDDCFDTDKFDCRTSEMVALLDRLEAAERVCNHIKENGFPKSLRDKAYDYMNAWRKAAGK